MPYYHNLTAEIKFWFTATEAEITNLFHDLFAFYGKTTFDDVQSTSEAKIILSSFGRFRHIPPSPLVIIKAHGMVDDAIESILNAVSERLSQYRHLDQSGCFVLTNAEAMTKTRIIFGADGRRARSMAILKSCMAEFLDGVNGSLPATRQKALSIDLWNICERQSAFRRTR